MVMVRAGIRCPMVGAVAGNKHPVTRANGTADGFRGNGVRTVLLAAGGRASRPTGCGGRAAEPLIIRSQIGAGGWGNPRGRRSRGRAAPRRKCRLAIEVK